MARSSRTRTTNPSPNPNPNPNPNPHPNPNPNPNLDPNHDQELSDAHNPRPHEGLLAGSGKGTFEHRCAATSYLALYSVSP